MLAVCPSRQNGRRVWASDHLEWWSGWNDMRVPYRDPVKSAIDLWPSLWSQPVLWAPSLPKYWRTQRIALPKRYNGLFPQLVSALWLPLASTSSVCESPLFRSWTFKFPMQIRHFLTVPFHDRNQLFQGSRSYFGLNQASRKQQAISADNSYLPVLQMASYR